MELWWLGQSGFRLRAAPDQGPTVFCDPFLSNHEDRSWQAPIGPEALAQADLVLVSHEHIDHLDRPALKAAAALSGSRFTLVIPKPLAQAVRGDLGLPEERVVGVQPDDVLERDGVTIFPVPSRHGVNVDDAYNFGEQLSGGLVRYLGYVVELDGMRAYHAGDCVPYAGQADRLRGLHPDLALLPINGRDTFRESDENIVGNMDFREAARLANDMGARILIPMHWELFASNRGYPGHLIDYVVNYYPGLTTLIFGRGACANVQ
jgi:L-ascorbate metabolism protein UlaG (beta-lactamase superfamily)